MTISYIIFSIMSRHSSILHTLNFIRSTNKGRQKREDHESNRLDRAMQCSKRKKFRNANPTAIQAECKALLLHIC